MCTFKKMKGILLTEKEVVFLVLLYVHALLKVIVLYGWIVQMVLNRATHNRKFTASAKVILDKVLR